MKRSHQPDCMRRGTIQRDFWNPVYDRFAGAYDAVDWLTGGYTHALRRRVYAYLPLPPARLLEVGMGTGVLHAELAARYDMAGVDLAGGMVRRTQRRLARAGLRSALAVGSVYQLPWQPDAFDAVLSTFAFSAFVDADAALDEMVRVTKPGGRVIIVDAGEALDGSAMAHALARAWEAMGDFMRDERPLMRARGLAVRREDYGPWHCVHVTTGILPDRE
jgi:ubiquinone/menaquinone biosynthesis C-methylase UbiE